MEEGNIENIKTEHLQFVDLYLRKGYNATTAYQEVYGTEYKASISCASRLLTNANIKALIEIKKKEIMDELGIDFVTQLKQLEFIKMKLIEQEKFKDAVTPIEVQNKMLGLNSPEQINIKEERITIVIEPKKL